MIKGQHKFWFLPVMLVLGGCGKHVEQHRPDIYLSSGLLVQIGEHETARAFGYDRCPVSERWTDGVSSGSNECIKLLPNKKIEVRLILESGVVMKERWFTAYKNERYTLTRPNGVQVKEISRKTDL